eukprot:350371-Chlamydomonas_euryale.AAC.10
MGQGARGAYGKRRPREAAAACTPCLPKEGVHVARRTCQHAIVWKCRSVRVRGKEAESGGVVNALPCMLRCKTTKRGTASMQLQRLRCVRFTAPPASLAPRVRLAPGLGTNLFPKTLRLFV